ncbi:MAG: hypothetical protein SYC29_18315 [Planctomycetota bacterium]|nr:hypothetical protein [Planctomycetota bacterium]
MDDFLQNVKAKVEQADVFDGISLADGMLHCAARGCAAPATYRLERAEGAWHVALVTPDRWLSESIEADLMHTGDPLEELIDEELVDLGHDGGPLPVSHYRSDEMLYTFRSPLPIENVDESAAVETASRCLLAYEAAFRELGDMQSGEET